MPLILIVDDSPTEVHVMQKALERHGYRTAVAADGAEGVRLARQMRPDLIFMDIVMPGVNAARAARIAERTRRSIQSQEFALGESGQSVSITVSIGLAEWRDGSNPIELYRRADRALYRSKAEGRNRVTQDAA